MCLLLRESEIDERHAGGCSARSRKTETSLTGGIALGISKIVVMPPEAAACVEWAKSSFSVRPGSRECTCGSMKPGKTSSPVASISSSATEAELGPSNAVMRPSSQTKSAE